MDVSSTYDLTYAIDGLSAAIRRLDSVLEREPPFSDRRFKLLEIKLQLRSLQRELEQA